MLQLPSVNPSRWRLRDAYLDGVTGLAALGAGLLASLRAVSDPSAGTPFFLGGVLLAVIGFVVSVVKARRSLAKEQRYEPLREPKEIVGWAKGCYELIDGLFDADEEFKAGEVRLTVYRVVYDRRIREPTSMEQMISYVGGYGGPPGRTVSVQTGIIGVAARSGQPVTAKRDAENLDQFRLEMVQKWGYTADGARQLSPDRWGFLACPITESTDGPVVAIVYLDAKEADLFERDDVQEAIIEQCGVLSQIIRECYA